MPNISSPAEIAKQVILWLQQQEDWLVIIDNLDDITVANGYLPANSLTNHTLITTRDTNARGIPALTFEIPLLEVSDAVKLLSLLSEIVVTENSEDYEFATAIVRELHFLPLAIEQAAAYTREVLGNFADFQEAYSRRHKDVLE